MAAKSQALSQKGSAMIALVNRMRDIGAHILFELPTIVFCGKQSAGKSSLIEAMSGVSLPRADGTCTRTPGELRLTETPGLLGKWCGFRVQKDVSCVLARRVTSSTSLVVELKTKKNCH